MELKIGIMSGNFKYFCHIKHHSGLEKKKRIMEGMEEDQHKNEYMMFKSPWTRKHMKQQNWQKSKSFQHAVMRENFCKGHPTW